MKFGQILVQPTKNNPNSFLAKLWRLEISPRPFFDFYKLVIMLIFNVNNSQLIFACSKSTIETLEKGVKYVQS